MDTAETSEYLPPASARLVQTFQDVYRSRHILAALTAKELKAQYRTLTLGFFWALLNPLVMVTVLTFVWIAIFKVGPEHPSRVIVALIPYNFIAYCFNGCATSITSNASLVKKVAFPRQILPISVILTHIVHLGVQALLIAAVLLIFRTAGPVLGPNLLWLFPIGAITLGLCIGVGMMVAALAVVFRDTSYALQSLLSVLFWLSPIVYDPRDPTTPLAESLHWLYFLNPVAGILDSFRAVLFYGQPPSAYALIMATIITTIIGAIGVRVFWVYERQFADLIR